MRVRDVMTEAVVTVDRDDSLQRAVGAMLREGIGSVLVTHGDEPAGILTDSDVLRAGFLAQRALPDITVGSQMSSPLVTVYPDETLDGALSLMQAEEIKKLPVEEDLEIVGILTMTDLARHRPSVVEEAVEMGGKNVE